MSEQDPTKAQYDLAVDMLEDLIAKTGVLPAQHIVEIRKTAGALVYKINSGRAS